MPTEPTDGRPVSGVESMQRICFVHAHPDDETLATGALIAHLVGLGVECDVITCTRGEMGEVVPGPLSFLEGTPQLESVRRDELTRALEELGVSGRAYLGTTPARVEGLEPRHYRDSGMEWVEEGLAGPADASDERSFTAGDIDDEVADLVAWLRFRRPDLVVSYDMGGGYGHPDHVRAHEVALRAAAIEGIAFGEIHHHRTPDMQWFDLPETLPIVQQALRCHATQLTVHGDDVVHSGGQLDPIRTSMGITLRS